MEHATAAPTQIAFIEEARKPFSNFDYIEKEFGDYSPIRRLFSQARSSDMRSMVSEKINAAGLVADENDEIKRVYAEHKMDDLRRITFWSEKIGSSEDLGKVGEHACIGYALVKQDSIPGRQWRWHVFEAVMRPTRFDYSYVHGWKSFDIRCGDRKFAVPGVLYCQQNNLNKACAQVALRSLCSLHVDPSEVSFRRINDFAAQVSGGFDPAQGLDVRQMRAVLSGFAIDYLDIDYTNLSDADRAAFAYQKFIYAGIESGAGALLGFRLAGPEAIGHHIIPFFGHTFNRDTWVPNADLAYFHVGEETRYIPSESWVSTFIGHDDNFGSNYCIPRPYIEPEQAQYAVSLYPKYVRYSGVEAEALAINMLYTIRGKITPTELPWHRRALEAIDSQRVVLRPQAVTKDEYISYLRATEDWESRKESSRVCDGLAADLPANLWLIELSLPELFPANLRKIGEVLLNAAIEPTPGAEALTFILARLPGLFVVQDGTDATGTPKFKLGPSELQSHTALFSKPQPSVAK